ncbi:hypothetical protein PUV47_13525 [Pseudovibrio exalbescens]|uniref:hypothetical protein n=1 Tax=Pseudovibrio exalbescens TaxID=197461 RepID=UPI002364FC43|nr:hypothetical protein [Pseudovibrio exalbescens]MDD7910943.1 hypothetical protein [Pseudovibrio exalbescens]
MRINSLKTKLVLTATALTLTALAAGTAAAQQRPNYPWQANVPYALQANQSRHHIIPWQELISYGVGEYVTLAEVQGFLDTYNLIGQANIGSFANTNDLAAAYVDEDNGDHNEANDVMFSLFAWMQGNLVVGPNNANRPHGDPGDAFDQRAYDCKMHYANAGVRNQFQNLQARWNGTPNQERVVFDTLSQDAMAANATATDQAAPPAPACAW